MTTKTSYFEELNAAEYLRIIRFLEETRAPLVRWWIVARLTLHGT